MSEIKRLISRAEKIDRMRSLGLACLRYRFVCAANGAAPLAAMQMSNSHPKY
jgi:hypothetical protein